MSLAIEDYDFSLLPIFSTFVTHCAYRLAFLGGWSRVRSLLTYPSLSVELSIPINIILLFLAPKERLIFPADKARANSAVINANGKCGAKTLFGHDLKAHTAHILPSALRVSPLSMSVCLLSAG